MLRTSLAKPGKENQGATPISLDAPKDTVRLKKHISSVMDRVSKGGRISDTRNAMGGEEKNKNPSKLRPTIISVVR